MRILTEWLAEMTDVPEDTESLAERITDIGLEVEEIIRLDRSISGVVIAEVTETNSHPDSRNLTICDVRADGTHAQVVTAAPGVSEGELYCWAPPDSTLPGGTVEREEFSGEPSEGMLCSSRELGLTEDAQTLLHVPDTFETGQPVVDVLDLNEPILELDLTPNRSDCLSHLGVARDYAAAEGLALNDPRPESLPTGNEADVDIQIAEPEDCWSYTGIPINGVNVTQSPFPIQKRLLKMGLRPLNNIVDVTNYTLFEVGHPLHPFDYDRMVDPVTIRRAEDDEQIRTLDGETRELSDEDLVIADKHGAQAMAGIMGGANAQVGRRTERILLEGAYFNPVRIRRTAGRHRMSTEASHRFERGTDPVTYRRCLARCVELMEEDPAHGDELTVFDPIDVREQSASRSQISFEPGTVPDVLGFDPGQETMLDQLNRLGIQSEEHGDVWELTPPTWRHDLERPEDITEEIVRLHGYGKIPTDAPTLRLDETIKPEQSVEQTIREFMVASGFNEVITYSFVDPDQHQFVNNGEPLSLENPLSRHTETMRRSILDGLLDTFETHHEEQTTTRIFEIGGIFPSGDEEEKQCLSFLMSGLRHRQRWSDCPSLDFYDASGLVRALFERLGLTEPTLNPETAEGFHDHRSASIQLADQSIGRVGQLNDGLELPVNEPVLAGEIVLDDLPTPDRSTVKSYSTQPIVDRDLDLVVDRDQYVEPMRDTIQEIADWLYDVTVFDVYEGDPLPEDKKSISFNFSFRHPERTLDAEEVNEVQDTIFDTLREQYGASLRTE